ARLNREMPAINFTEGETRKVFRPFILAKSDAACGKFIELAGVGGGLIIAAARKSFPPNTAPASLWVFYLFQTYRGGANAFYRGLSDGCAIDDPFTASVRAIEAILQRQAAAAVR